MSSQPPMDLFGLETESQVPREKSQAPRENTSRQAKLNQYLTPAWLAEALIERYCADLVAGHSVLDPTCGDGAFLAALPPGIQPLGIEIDPELADRARCIQGARVVTGDIRHVVFDEPITRIMGNPPFKASILDVLLERAAGWLSQGGMAGLILPAYLFQTANTVMRYNRTWGVAIEMIPRNVYPGLEKPLVFARFTRDAKRHLVGLAFFAEAAEIAELDKRYRETLIRARGSVWKQTAAQALRRLGGEAPLEAIYREVAGHRPTATQHWKAKIRQVLQESFIRIAPAHYALGDESLAA